MTTSRRRHVWQLAMPLVLLAVVLDVAGAQTSAPDASGLSGRWVLNQGASGPVAGDDRDSRERGGRGRGAPPPGAGGRGGGRGGGMRGGPGGGRGGGGNDRDREEMKQMRDLMDEVLTPTARLLVMQRDPDHVTLVDADGHARTYALTNEKEPHQLVNGTVQTKARWEQGQLVITVAIDKGPVIVQSYRRGDAQLIVTSQMEGARGGGRVAVYDAEEQ